MFYEVSVSSLTLDRFHVRLSEMHDNIIIYGDRSAPATSLNCISICAQIGIETSNGDSNKLQDEDRKLISLDL